ncbi:group 1 truncated hemoglobin [Acidihalobacter ferrooxydans]|uniref:Group 1 truncated hemoglobin n=2 Tax=Acidihalobacter ferrooxydans TaxID=1765967 RepID=A0A1P8UL37_9GAMM|nr:group 1 truncated hemoglobin [Acidihalobacter ferrooxydans]
MANEQSIKQADVHGPIKNYYKTFGGMAGIKALTNTFVDNVAADPHINYYFAHANIPQLKYQLAQQFCVVLGGPCKYTGQTMTQAHKGLQITTAAFNYLAADMMAAMKTHNIPMAAQNYFIAQLAAMEPQIVTK